MGLAQKMAVAQAAQAAQGGGGNGPPPKQYQAYHPSQSPQFNYGRPPPPGQQQQTPCLQDQQSKQYYCTPLEQDRGHFNDDQSPSGPLDVCQYIRQLEEAIQQKRLQSFYPPGDPRIQATAQRAAQQVDKLVAAWHIPREIAVDIVRLALYDVVIYNDDSGSMAFEEQGKRIKDLELIMQRVAFAANLCDEDGIETRFMNNDDLNTRTEQQIARTIANRRYYEGLKPFGARSRQKLFDDIVFPKSVIEEDWYTGQSTGALEDTIRYAVNANHNLGTGAGAFQFLSRSPFGPSVDSDQNRRTWPKRPDDPEDYRLDPWVVKSILDTIGPIHSIYKPPANPYSSRGLAYDPGRPHLTSTLAKSHDGWALLNHMHNLLGFGSSQHRAWRHLCDADTWSGAAWVRCKSNATSVLKRARRFVENFSSRTLATACLLGGIPHVSGAPLSPGEAMLVATHDFESFMDGLGSILFAVTPLVVLTVTAARLWYILRWPTRDLAHPVYSGALATMAGFVYWAVRHDVGDTTGKEAIVLAVFVACWTSFVADSRRKIKEKKQYLLLVLFGGAIICLLGTALQHIDQDSHKLAPHAAGETLNHTAGVGSSLEPGTLEFQEATAYLTSVATNGPFMLIITTVIIYLWRTQVEADPESRPVARA